MRLEAEVRQEAAAHREAGVWARGLETEVTRQEGTEQPAGSNKVGGQGWTCEAARDERVR